MKNYLQLTQSTERQTFNRFTTPPEEIDNIHNRLPSEDDETDAGTEGALAESDLVFADF